MMNTPDISAKTDQEIRRIETQETSWQRAAWTFVILGTFVGFWGALQISGEPLSWADKLDKLGGFLSGAVATSFSLAGLMFVYLAFLGQKKELLYQREELALTRQEMHRQVEATQELTNENAAQKQQMELQNAQLQKQAFENTFFEMLKLLNDIVSNTSLGLEQQSIKGKACFSSIIFLFRTHYRSSEIYNLTLREKNQDVLQKIRNQILDKSNLGKFDSSLTASYRHLSNIFLFVENSRVENKDFYFDLVGSLLSVHERVFLFYYALPYFSTSNLEKLITQFGLLKFLSDNDLLHPSHKILYEPSAYGELTESSNPTTEEQDAY